MISIVRDMHKRLFRRKFCIMFDQRCLIFFQKCRNCLRLRPATSINLQWQDILATSQRQPGIRKACNYFQLVKFYT